MDFCFLPIPATRVASEWIFSRAHSIIGLHTNPNWLRSSCATRSGKTASPFPNFSFFDLISIIKKLNKRASINIPGYLLEPHLCLISFLLMLLECHSFKLAFFLFILINHHAPKLTILYLLLHSTRLVE